MGVFDDFVCETRYCPDCGMAIFCRTGANEVTIFYTSESMDTSVTCCPECELDLLGGDKNALLQEQPAEAEVVASRPAPSRPKAGKTEFIEAMHAKDEDTFPSKAAAKRAFEAVSNELTERLGSGEEVAWPGVGTFKLKKRKARQGRNPQTGEPMTIPAHTVVTFTPAKNLKEKVNP